MIYFSYFSFCIIYLELKRQILLYTFLVRLKTILVKIYTCFQTKTAQKPAVPFGAGGTPTGIAAT